jgi:hypothetical protein
MALVPHQVTQALFDLLQLLPAAHCPHIMPPVPQEVSLWPV